MSEIENKRKPRPLKGTDIFLMTSIISKIGVRNIMRCMNALDLQNAVGESGQVEDEAKKAQIGTLIFYGVVDVVFERLEYCEGAICKLLARLYDMQESDVKELGANKYLDMFIDVVKDENFVDFFKQAYESVKRMM